MITGWKSLSAFVAFTLLFTGMPHASATDSRLIDIVQITWTGASTSPASSLDLESAIKNEVSPAWKAFTNLDKSPSNPGITFVHGKTLNGPIVISTKMLCEGSGFNSFMNSIREEAYKRLNLPDWRDRYLIILTPEA